jgi:glycine hydroxymethyltransferase
MLDHEGFVLLGSKNGYTESHQVVVDASPLGGGKEASLRLEKANIICNANLLPRESLRYLRNPSGLRLGVQEVTKLGMKEDGMRKIADFMRRVLIDRQNPCVIKKEVREFRGFYRQVRYCFDQLKAYREIEQRGY